MQRRTFLVSTASAAGAVVLGGVTRPGAARAVIGAASTSNGPFDFSDAFYQLNGVKPNRIPNRVNGQDGDSVLDTTDDPNRRGVRVIATTGGFNAFGNLIYYNVFGDLRPNSFTENAAGSEARDIADRFVAFHFPKQSGDPLDGDLPNRRQDNIFDTRNGYFTDDPLGLWVLAFVSYTDRAFNTDFGRERLAGLAADNGFDLDGTPMIRTAPEIESLLSGGLVVVRTRPAGGSRGVRWKICPVFNPTGGAITRDAFLLQVLRANGRPLVPELRQEFICLQRTGDFCE